MTERENPAGGGMEKHIARFLAHLRWVRQLSKHTIDAYRRDLHHLQLCAEAPADITAPMLREALAQQSAKGAHPSTIARRLAAWRMFFDFLRAGKVAAVNPARGINAPKKPSRLPRALTPEQTHRFLAADNDGESGKPIMIRDRAIMELLYSSALRVSELTALDVNDVDGGCTFVAVRSGKGGGGRVVPVGAAARNALHKWLAARVLLTGDIGGALFVGRGGRRLGSRAVQQRLQKRAAKTAMGVPVSPHVLRHSSASHFLQSSGDLRATQEILGHKDIAATQIYTRLDFHNLATTYDRAHPRAKKIVKKDKKTAFRC
ncbi:MAG: tyrosine-type recombinase/integrase [Gammaproteobacteria bacterium]